MTAKIKRITAAQAAKVLNISKTRVLQLINLNILPADKIGNQYVLKKKDVEAARGRKPGRPRTKPLPVVQAAQQSPIDTLIEDIKNRIRQSPTAIESPIFRQVPRAKPFGFEDFDDWK